MFWSSARILPDVRVSLGQPCTNRTETLTIERYILGLPCILLYTPKQQKRSSQLHIPRILHRSIQVQPRPNLWYRRMFHVPLTSGSHSFKAWALVAFVSVSSSLLDSAFITPRSEGCGWVEWERSGLTRDALTNNSVIRSDSDLHPLSYSLGCKSRFLPYPLCTCRELRWP